jgi:hypothetical protein
MEGTALNHDSKIQSWDAPKTLEAFAAESASSEVTSGGVKCPGCGRVLFTYKTKTGKTRIIRYEECRTPGCQRKFKTRQSHREIIDEIKSKEISSAGIHPVEASKKRL